MTGAHGTARAQKWLRFLWTSKLCCEQVLIYYLVWGEQRRQAIASKTFLVTP